VVSDTHVRLAHGDPSSPYRRSELAAGRARYLLRELVRLRPRFVVHLGDLVQAVPGFPSHQPAMAAARDLLRSLPCPVYVAPGNHDVGDKQVAWAPAPTVDEAHIRLFEHHWGTSYGAFDHGDCHFVLLNSPVLNSGLPAELEQRRWLEADLEAHRGRRLFLLTHYPLFVTDPQEEEHYDNIGEPARGWLLGLAQRTGVEAVFAGHVHHFIYNRYASTDCYVGPSTAFTRQDYSELFRVAPVAEGGRNDVQKLGFLVVDVYERGHTVRFQRTAGRSLRTVPAPAPDAAAPGAPGGGVDVDGSSHRRPGAPAADGAGCPVGVYLRHVWDEVTLLPHAGPLDEFTRKAVRNDYPLLALWTMGIRRLRVPVSDLLLDVTRERMAALAARGARFTVCTLGLPAEPVRRALRRHRAILASWELVLPQDRLAESAPAIRAARGESGLPVYLSCLESPARPAQAGPAGAPFHHVVRHGFRLDGLGSSPSPQLLRESAADGLVFRLPPSQSPAAGIRAAREAGARLGVRPIVHVQLQASDDPAQEQRDDTAIANRVAETVAAAFATPSVEALLDTFVDHDRGYFVRHGLIDRRHNPRPAYHALRHLCAWLAGGPEPLRLEVLEAGEAERVPGRRLLALRAPGSLRGVLCVSAGTEAAVTRAPPLPDLAGVAGAGRWIDLVSGRTCPPPGGGGDRAARRRGRSPRGATPALFVPDA
jgi:hypothetical protein